jgi:serine/threonine protein kinase/WD40 repeat protein
MSPDRWPEVERLYEQVVALPIDQRAAFLLNASNGDDGLRREVESLLNLETVATDFLEQPALRAAAHTLSQALTHLKPPDVPGYNIIRELGEGGMGVVYLAEQRVPFQRIVALKLIRPGMDSRQVLARFERERQALARMDHPNIAAVFDAGSTTDGRPYFVMEFVDGLPITEYCDSRSLSIPARLSLFIQVCNAVQHAHQKGVIHRDLKPSNVLVIDQDGQAVPKVIDFGTAKSADPISGATTLATDGLVFGTVEYMSPEQATFSGDIDTTTDVYSLGVLLYELLVGCTPFDRQRVETSGLEGVLRAIRDSDPPRPSFLLSRKKDSLASVAVRGTEVGVLAKQLSRDLDWIVLKALEKDRHRRYPTAVSLGADVQRFLDSKPIEARPPSVSYRVRKFTRRYRGAVAATAGVGLTLILGFGASTSLYWQSERNRKEAERQGQAATAAADSLRIAMNELEYRAYVATITAADAEGRSGKLASARKRLLEIGTTRRNWEWWYLFNQTHSGLFETVSETRPCSSSAPLGVFPSQDASQVLAVDAASGTVVLRRCRAVETWALSGAKVATFHAPESNPPFLTLSPRFRIARTQTVLAVDPRSKSMVLAEMTGTARERAYVISVFDPQTKRLTEFARVTSWPHCADISRDGRQLAIGLWRNSYRVQSHSFEVWRIGVGRVAEFIPPKSDRDVNSFPLVCQIALSPDGTLVASSGTTVDVWNVESGTAHMSDARRPGTYHQPIAFSQTGDRLAIGRADGSIDVVQIADASAPPLTLRDARSGAPNDGAAGLRPNLDLLTRSRAVVALAFSADGSILAAGAGKTVTTWDLAQRRSNMQASQQADLVGVALSPDGRIVYSVDVAGYLRGLPVSLPSIVIRRPLTSASRVPILINDSGTVIAGAGLDSGLSVLRFPDLQRTKVRPGNGKLSTISSAQGLALSHDGTRLYTSESGGAVQMRTLPGGHSTRDVRSSPFAKDSDCVVAHMFSDDIDSLAISADDRYLALGQYNCVVILEALTLRPVISMKLGSGLVSDLQFRDDGIVIVALIDRSLFGQSRIQAWDWRKNTTVATVYPRTDDPPLVSLRLTQRLTQSGDGKKIGLLSYPPGQPAVLSIWDRDLRTELGRLQVGDSIGVALSADGSRAVSVSGEDSGVQLWDTIRFSRLLTLPDSEGHTAGVRFTKLGQIIAGRSSGGITIWDPRLPTSR